VVVPAMVAVLRRRRRKGKEEKGREGRREERKREGESRCLGVGDHAPCSNWFVGNVRMDKQRLAWITTKYVDLSVVHFWLCRAVCRVLFFWFPSH